MDCSNRGLDFLIGVFVLVLLVLQFPFPVPANLVFQVHRKFTGNNSSLIDYKEHDFYRHRRILSDADLPLGGDSSPTSAALYFTNIQIGSPPKEYYVQVDTGSDFLWINCDGCTTCPTKSDLGIPLSLYDPMVSESSRLIMCDHEFCTATVGQPTHACSFETRCQYLVQYADGSSSMGYFVKDKVQLNRITGDYKTGIMKRYIKFGCGYQQSDGFTKSQQAVNGIIGFGQANSSLISQLASAKMVKKMFSHCLSGSRGGIFAIGEVMHPKVNTTPILPNMSHFNIELKTIKVGEDFVTLPPSKYNTPAKRGVIIDSGTTLAYLPEEIYNEIYEKIMVVQPGARIHIFNSHFKCFTTHGDVDDHFPHITFYFENSVHLKVYPHQYLFRTHGHRWCIGFMSTSTQVRESSDVIVLGDLALTDKLVTYNMEDQTLGWIDYDCTTSIKVKDEETGKVYEVGAHDISRAGRVHVAIFMWVVFIIAVVVI